MDITATKQKLYEYLKKNNKTITFAESCTGGLIASSFCEVSGVSTVFKGSIVSYSDEVKINNLNVSKETIKAHTAVSNRTAEEMARNAAHIFNADYSISVTGYAGPDGGTDMDPVGTFYLGFYIDGKTNVIREYHPGLSRNDLRNKALECAFIRITEMIKCE